MTLYYIAIYHNADNRFSPYEPGHPLTKVISHWRHLPTGTSPEEIADWAFRAFNADLDQLQGRRGGTVPDGEMAFLLACTYRLLRRRSLSIADVIAVTTMGSTTWLACDSAGWRHIAAPDNRTGTALTAATIHEHLRPDGDE